MKLSRFNIIIQQNRYAYWYNSLSRCFFKISSGLSDKILSMLSSNSFDDIPYAMLSKLKDGSFILNEDIDELEIVRQRNRKAIDDKNYFLIILPTLNCNYHCWYCIQDHIESRMSLDTINKIKRHIDYMIEVEQVESIHVDWFGGEPLLYFNEVVVPISEYAKEKCEKACIKYTTSSTTNGYFLKNDIIKKCIDLNFEHFQITLDGDKESHDKVKFQKGCESTFSHVLKNINDLISSTKQVRIFLRINYTHKNLSEKIVEDVNKHIRPENRDQIVITPRKVWQEANDPNFHEVLKEILDLFKESGYLVQYWNPTMDFVSCYANKKYYNAINYNGNVVKCTACDDLYSSDPKGILCEDGTIKWTDNFDELYTCPTFENERCLNCNKLPICMGLCPRENVNGEVYCKDDGFDLNFEKSIIDHINRSYM